MIYENLTEDECAFYSLIMDESGIDIAEFCMIDDTTYDEETGERGDGCWRAYPFQYAWYRDKSTKQIDAAGRSIGKSMSIKLRAFAFALIHAGQEMVITAPEGNHLDLVTDNIETLFLNCKFANYLLAPGRTGIKHRPFLVNLANSARITGRIPQRDGRGVKGIHPIWLELDEGQDYPTAGWTELGSTVKDENPNARWRVHGVTRGVGDDFDDIITGKEPGWRVHRLPAMYTPNWNEARKKERINKYHGEDSPDYRRNILGLPGDGNSPLFVLHRIFQNVDTDEGSNYNMDEYYNILIDEAEVREVGDIIDLVDPPASHLNYKRVWMGMDFGLTTSASCIVVFGEVREPKEQDSRLKLLSKITMKRVIVYDQVRVIKHLMSMYRPMAFAFDAHGVGQPAYDWIQQEVRTDEDVRWMLERVKGYSFSKKMIVDFDENVHINENDPEGWKEAAIERLGAEASIDALRILIDTTRFRFPYDKDLIGELQAVPKKDKPVLDEYGKPKRKVGQHTLDALRFAALGYSQHAIEGMIQKHQDTWVAPTMMILDYG